ncbi:MAG: hypothetical protein JSV09_13080, partial [Thermoplasmata archaeon]
GGNFWSDYTGKDSYSGINQDIFGSDGLGDIPYDIFGGTEKDQYPLLRPILPIEGDILITSHEEGDYVSGTIVVEAAVTFSDLEKVNFYIDGVYVLSDDSYPYQCILDTTEFPEDVGFDLKAEAVVYPSYPFPTTITLIQNNMVQSGNYIAVTTLKSEYQPDEEVTVIVNILSPPSFDSMNLMVSNTDLNGNPYFMTLESLPSSSQYTVGLPIFSDAILGPYTISATAYGYDQGSLIWEATNTSTFLVSGESMRSQLENMSADFDYLVLQLLSVNDSLQVTLLEVEGNILDGLGGLNDTNILSYLQGMNSSLFDEVDGLLISITDDVIGMNASLSDQLTGLLDDITTDDDALREWLEIVLDAIDANLTETDSSLQAQLGQLNNNVSSLDDMEATFNNLAKLNNILNNLSALDDHLDEVNEDLQGSIDEVSSEKGEEMGMAEGLLIIVIILLVIILLMMLMGRKEKKPDVPESIREFEEPEETEIGEPKEMEMDDTEEETVEEEIREEPEIKAD